MKKGLLITLLTAIGIMFSPDLLAATKDVDAAATNLTETVGTVGILFNSVVMLGGAIFAFLGIVGLKKYAEDDRQNPLMKPLIMFIAGSLALGFTAFTNILTNTTVEDDVENADIYKPK